MSIEKIRFINRYDPQKGGSFILKENLDELYDNKEGFMVDDFKDNKNKIFDKTTGEEYICGFPVVYQVTSHNNIPSIFKNGFDRAFTGSKAGNMYGAGVYSTYRLASTQDNVKHGLYGDTFVKMLVLSKFKDFLIYDKGIAKKVHGNNWRIEDQLLMFFGERKCNEFKQKGLWRGMTDIHNLTSNNALAVWQGIGDEELIRNGIGGFIFYGGHDGFVAVLRDFKNVLPVAYSTDRGKTWIDDKFNQDTVNTIFYDVDVRTFLGKDIDKYADTKNVSSGLNKRIQDMILVKDKKTNKYNFLDINKNKISPHFDFDVASPPRENGLAYVEINDPKFVEFWEEPFQGYVSKKGLHTENDPDDYTPWTLINSNL